MPTMANHTQPTHRESNGTAHAPHTVSFVAFDAAVASLCVIVAALVACLACYTYTRRMPRSTEAENEYHICGTAWTFPEVEAATGGFAAGRLLGRGPRGSVYRAVFPDGRVLAAKRFEPAPVPGLGFAAQAKALARARHPNVVAVAGYCEAPGPTPAERILVTEYMPRRSLQYHLHGGGGVLFDWSHRLRIAVQAAQGLAYLHEGTAPPIVHGDVKPSNVLLDSTWSARVADFGQAFLAPPGQALGTVGYVDPRGGCDLCKPADVYAFGVVLLEILSGRPCLGGGGSGHILDWALPLIAGCRSHEVIDGRLQAPANAGPLIRMARLAAACVRNVREKRPTMLRVVAVLKQIEEEIMAASYVVPSQQPCRGEHPAAVSK